MKRILIVLIFFLNVSKTWAQPECSQFGVFKGGEACPNQQVNFDVYSQTTDFSVSWDFGDGTSATGKSVSHVYTNTGPFTATASMRVPATGAIVCKKEITVTSLCNIDPGPGDTPPGNPFLEGTQGNWKVKRTFVLQTERNQTRLGANDNLNLRIDGTYKNFYTFWSPASGSGLTWVKQNESKWTFKTQINYYNPFGSFELESMDPLNRYSAATYGYNNTLPVAVGSNSKMREIGFDSFEDYMLGKCANNHFSFQFVLGIENKLTEKASHSGRWSIRLAPGETVIMKKSFANCEPEPGPPIIE